MERKTNWIAIVVAAVAAMVIGFLWYGPLFSKPWMAAYGFTMDEANQKLFKDGVELPMDMTPMIFNTLAMFVFAFLMNWLTARAGANTWAEGAKIGAIVGIFVGATRCLGLLFAAEPGSLLPIEGLYPVVQLSVMGAILGGWKKK